MDQTTKVAHRLFENWNARRTYEAMTGPYEIGSMADAYEVQRALQLLHAEKRGTIAGRKIALTSKAIQEMCGLDQPVGGAIFAGDVHLSPATIRRSDFVRLGIEFELALELKDDVPPQAAAHDRHSARKLVAMVRPAFELIEDRAADYANLDAHTLIADNAWCGGIVLGEPLANWHELDLGNIPSCVTQPEEPDEHTNTGEADPLGSLAWVLNHFSARNMTLSKGEHIITGSAVRTRFPKPGESFAYTVAGATVSLDVI